MTFHALEESVRALLLKRIRHGSLTALSLAHDTGFQQAHISNFLNRKRGLSLTGLDRVLAAQHLSIVDLVECAPVRGRTRLPSQNARLVQVALVDALVAATIPRFSSHDVIQTFVFRKSFLHRLRPSDERPRWERFALVRIDARDGLAMYPRLLPAATVLLDRHYNGLAPYRQGAPNMYLVLCDGICSVRYLELHGRQIILRPENPAYPVQLKTISSVKTVADYIVGRICHISSET